MLTIEFLKRRGWVPANRGEDFFFRKPGACVSIRHVDDIWRAVFTLGDRSVSTLGERPKTALKALGQLPWHRVALHDAVRGQPVETREVYVYEIIGSYVPEVPKISNTLRGSVSIS